MAGVGREPSEGAEELGINGKDTGTVGSHPTGLRDVLQDSGAVGYSIWVGDVGDDPLHGKGLVNFPAQGRQEDYGDAAGATVVWDLVVTISGDSDV